MLVCEQRLSYTEATPGWAPFLTLNLEQSVLIDIGKRLGADLQAYVRPHSRLNMARRRFARYRRWQSDLPVLTLPGQDVSNRDPAGLG